MQIFKNIVRPLCTNSDSPITRFSIKVDCLRRKYFNPTHWHDYVQLWYVLEGTLTQVINGVRYFQEPGSAVIVLPYMLHSVDSSESEADPVVLSVSFDDTLLTSAYIPFFTYDNKHAFFEHSTIPTMKQLTGDAHKRADAISLTMLTEFEKHMAMSLPLLRESLYELLELICAGAPKYTPLSNAAYIHDRARLITNAARYISQNASKRLSIDMLSSRSLMSRSTFTSGFRDITGQTFSSYLTTTRLMRAYWYLIFSDDKLSDIARMSGFANAGHLSKVFTDRFRLSPMKCRCTDRPEAFAQNELYMDKWKWIYQLSE